MRRLLALSVVLLLLTGCSGRIDASPSPPGDTPTQEPARNAEFEATAGLAPSLPPTSEPAIQRTNWLVLGRDFRAHREGTGRGFQTDVMMLVSVLESDPLQITLVQYPRNLYVDVPRYSPTWLFSVWREHGYQGLHDYWQQAFGVSIQGIFLVDMDSFVLIADDLGMDGEGTLVFLRDNDAMWGCGLYDCEQRAFSVLRELWGRAQSYVLSNPVVAANAILIRWNGLVESDLNFAGKLIFVLDLAWKVRSSEYELRMVQLGPPAIRWDDVPGLNVPRGWAANTDLVEWHECTLNWECEDG